MANKPFQIELSDFKFVTNNRTRSGGGRSLRLTVTWRYEDDEWGVLGWSQEGWLVTKNPKDYKCAPPISSFSPFRTRQLNMITTDLHELMLRMLRESKTSSGNSFLDYLEAPEYWNKKMDPSEIDGELPLVINTPDQEQKLLDV